MLEKLKKKWNITSNRQLTIIILVFALTGSTSAWISKPICVIFQIEKATVGFAYFPLKMICLLVLYQFLLLLFGMLLGQFVFFWNFEKKMLSSMGLGFMFSKKRE